MKLRDGFDFKFKNAIANIDYFNSLGFDVADCFILKNDMKGSVDAEKTINKMYYYLLIANKYSVEDIDIMPKQDKNK